MSIEENKATVRRFLEEVWNKGNVAVIDEVFAPNYVYAAAGLHGPEAIKRFFRLWRGAFPDLKIVIEDMIAEGDKVVTRARFQGTSRGVWRDAVFGKIPPNGKPIAVTSTTISRIAGGQIVEEWEDWDYFGLLQQLGAIQVAPAVK